MSLPSPKPLRIDDLPEGPVVAFSARPADAVRLCGGALALHARRGDSVVLVVLAGGSGQEFEAREAEVRAAAMALGIEDVTWLGAEPEALGDDHDLVANASAWAAESALIYAPEGVDSQARVTLAIAAALARSTGAGLLLYGPGPAVDHALDVSLARPELEQALERLGEGIGSMPRTEAVRRITLDDATDALCTAAGLPQPRATAVLSTWNKCADVIANLETLHAQTYPFARVVVVDNASSDETMAQVRSRFPDVELVVMPHSAYGACETFNIGFACADTELIAILDDDILLPPTWLERAVRRMDAEPETTAIVSTKIVEPQMPESYRTSEAINTERYMSTFRGCASLARKAAIAECGYYDERLFIYGNERDLTCRLLNRGYRVLQFPGTHAFHKTPFGVQMGKRSLYYHARNAWIVQLKYAPLSDLLRLPTLVVRKVLMRSDEAEVSGEVSDATGTIGIGASIRATKGAWWILFKAACNVLWNMPYCLKRREPCRAPDYELPVQ